MSNNKPYIKVQVELMQKTLNTLQNSRLDITLGEGMNLLKALSTCERVDPNKPEPKETSEKDDS